MVMKTAVVPYSCFEDIKRDFEEFSRREDLNGFQKRITAGYSAFSPELDFTPRSVIIYAVPPKIVSASFKYLGKQYKSVFEVVADEEPVLESVKNTFGGSYRYYYDFWLPDKRTAVRSGLCEYGRNNVCYADGFGSILTLFMFISDMPCPKDYVWREVKNMDMCEGCDLCLKACPTGAILPSRFLIDNERCLSFFSGRGNEPFPAFIPETAHHRIFECSLCQECCPANNFSYGTVTEEVDFDEAETNILLSGIAYDKLPPELSAKAERCAMKSYFDSVPRNLKALIKAADLSLSS